MERTRCLACMAKASKACITASFMQIPIVSVWRLRQRRFCACQTGSYVPQSPAVSKEPLNVSRRQSVNPSLLFATTCLLYPFSILSVLIAFSPFCLIKTNSSPVFPSKELARVQLIYNQQQ